MRVLNVTDGFSASAAPTTLSAVELPAYADDAAYVTAQGAPSNGHAYLDTTLGVIKVYLTGAWLQMITTTGVAALTNKDYDGGTASNARRVTVPKDTKANLDALTRKAGTVLYATDHNKVYGDNGSLLSGIGGGGGGSAVIWRLPLANAPFENDSLGLELLDFANTEEQEAYCLLQVPSDYAAGTQIKLIGGSFGLAAASGKVFFKTLTTLIEDASTVLGTYTNQHTSTNAEVTVPATPSTVKAIGEMDLTTAAGLINAVAVAAGDWLFVKIWRDVSAESSSAAADARLLRFSMTPKFSA